MRPHLLAFVTAITLCAQTAFAQTVSKEVNHREQLWLGFFSQTRLTNKFGLWFDIHYRRTDHFTDRAYQFLVRPALTYYIKDNVRIHAGYAFAEYFPARGLHTTRPEHRPWQQIWWGTTKLGLSLRQWVRLEERFNRQVANDTLLNDYNFNFRLRYNVALSIPLKGKEIVPHTPFAVIMNEVFLNFGGNIVYNTFDQNRFFAGIGYQLTSRLNAHLGYMNIYQQEATGNKYMVTHAIRLYIFHTLDLRNKL